MKMRSFTCVQLDSLCDCKYVDRQQQTDSSALTNKLKTLNYGCVVRALFAVHASVSRAKVQAFHWIGMYSFFNNAIKVNIK